MTNKILERRIKDIEKHLPTLTATSESAGARARTNNPATWRQLLLDFADAYPEHHDYILQRVEAVERKHGFLPEPNEDENRDTFIDQLVAWTKEELGIVKTHMANIDCDFNDENARMEAKELLENIRNQNELMLELLTT